MPNWYLIEMLQYTDVVLDNKSIVLKHTIMF